METNKLIQRFIRGKDHDKTERCLDYLKEYIGKLEEENDGYRTILANPDAEIARLKEEIRQLNYKLLIHSNHCVEVNERADGMEWYRKHRAKMHPEIRGEDYHWEIAPFPLGVNVSIVCENCGCKHCVRTD